MTLSAPAVASALPSARQATPRTWCVWPSNGLTSAPVATLNTFMNRSVALEAEQGSVGRKADTTDGVAMGVGDGAHQRAIDRVPDFQFAAAQCSPPPVASSLPSGLKSSESTRSTNFVGSFTLPIVRSSDQAGRVPDDNGFVGRRPANRRRA